MFKGSITPIHTFTPSYLMTSFFFFFWEEIVQLERKHGVKPILCRYIGKIFLGRPEFWGQNKLYYTPKTKFLSTAKVDIAKQVARVFLAHTILSVPSRSITGIKSTKFCWKESNIFALWKALCTLSVKITLKWLFSSWTSAEVLSICFQCPHTLVGICVFLPCTFLENSPSYLTTFIR